MSFAKTAADYPGIINTPMVAGMLVGEEEVMKEMMRDVPIGRLGRGLWGRRRQEQTYGTASQEWIGKRRRL